MFSIQYPVLNMWSQCRKAVELQPADTFYPKIAVAYTRIATIATDEHHTLQEFRASVGAQWPFLSDAGRTVQKDLDIQERQPQGNKKQTNGGVILGLHFHGNTAVHAPLVPINSGVALRTCGQLYKNRALVTDNALVHVMLLSGTRRDRGLVLACWECSRKKIGELRLRILPGLGESRFDAPDGFLFVNWEESSSAKVASSGGFL